MIDRYAYTNDSRKYDMLVAIRFFIGTIHNQFYFTVKEPSVEYYNFVDRRVRIRDVIIEEFSERIRNHLLKELGCEDEEGKIKKYSNSVALKFLKMPMYFFVYGYKEGIPLYGTFTQNGHRES